MAKNNRGIVRTIENSILILIGLASLWFAPQILWELLDLTIQNGWTVLVPLAVLGFLACAVAPITTACLCAITWNEKKRK